MFEYFRYHGQKIRIISYYLLIFILIVILPNKMFILLTGLGSIFGTSILDTSTIRIIIIV